jgi:hypothetical protein
MKGHGEKLSRKQEALISALLLAPTLADAAHTAGIGEVTAWRWLKDSTFQDAYREARLRASPTCLPLKKVNASLNMFQGITDSVEIFALMLDSADIKLDAVEGGHDSVETFATLLDSMDIVFDGVQGIVADSLKHCGDTFKRFMLLLKRFVLLLKRYEPDSVEIFALMLDAVEGGHDSVEIFALMLDAVEGGHDSVEIFAMLLDSMDVVLDGV